MGSPKRQTTVRFRRIGLELKKLRHATGMDLTEAARFLRRSPASLCRLEGGAMIRERDLEYILDKYAAPEPLRSALLELSARAVQRGWWHRYAKSASPEFMDFISLEQDARTIRSRQMDLVPGLLQTEDYARSLFSTGLSEERKVSEIEAAVSIRMKRQQILASEKAPHLSALINEGALHQQIGGIEVMRVQMRYLLEAMERPNIDFRILPYGAGYFHGTFTIMEVGVRGKLPIATAESSVNTTYVEDPAEVAALSGTFQRIWDAALPEDDTRGLLHRLSSCL